MNAAHLHIILVHVPVIIVPLAALLLGIGIWKANATLRTTAFLFFVGSAAVAGVAFLLGEGAEELVENIAGVVKSAIDPHEDSAEIALWITVALGVASLGALACMRFATAWVPRLQVPILVLGVVASAALAYTAQQGGRIRHSEAFADDPAMSIHSEKPD